MYYETVRGLKARISAFQETYSRFCALIANDESARDDPAFTLRLAATLENIWNDANHVSSLTWKLKTRLTNFSKRSEICSHAKWSRARQRHQLREAETLSLEGIVNLTLSSSLILKKTQEICANFFSTTKILECMTEFMGNMERCIAGLKTLNESYVVSECITSDGTIDLNKLF